MLCSRAERLDEALAWYEKVRKARKSDPGASVTQRGMVHNNIASVWRRKGDFARARTEVERAIKILAPENGAALAHAFGSYGEIFRDEGQHENALGWFRRAREAFERQPSPKVDLLVIKLENEAGALERLGRASEALEARGRIATLKGEKVPSAPALPAEAKAMAAAASHAREAVVIVTLDGVGLPDAIYENFDLAALEGRLEKRLLETGAGECDGHEFGRESTRLFFYGADARALFAAIAPILRDSPLCRGARISVRDGITGTEFPLETRTLN